MNGTQNKMIKPPVTRHKNKILIILHQASSTSGRIGQILLQAGYELDIRRPVLNDPLPTTLNDYAGTIVFGGPMSVNDDLAFIHDEIKIIDTALKEKAPLLGICLGAQLLAKSIGAKVCKDKNGRVEAGWYPIDPTPKGMELITWPKMVYHFHNEGITDLPKEADLLAKGNTFSTQAFRYGENAWGIQFHTELTQAMMQSWIVRGAERLTEPNAQIAPAHLEGRLLYDAALKQWITHLLQRLFEEKNLA